MLPSEDTCLQEASSVVVVCHTLPRHTYLCLLLAQRFGVSSMHLQHSAMSLLYQPRLEMALLPHECWLLSHFQHCQRLSRIGFACQYALRSEERRVGKECRS